MQDITPGFTPEQESDPLPLAIRQVKRPGTSLSIWDKLDPPQLTFPNHPVIPVLDLPPLRRRTFYFDPGELSPNLKLREILDKLELVISTAAKYTLFEFNDEFTRRCLLDITNPYLEHAKVHGQINDYRVVCDESNNLASHVDQGQFVANIFIKPTKAIKFIELNFVATKTGVDFSEIVAQF